METEHYFDWAATSPEDPEILREALECDDSEALQKLLDAHGVALSDEQLDFIAGGRFLNAAGGLGESCLSD